MKRPEGMPEDEWREMLKLRKRIAVDRMTQADLKNGFTTIAQVKSASSLWGVSDHTAEQRLHRGETPDAWGDV